MPNYFELLGLTISYDIDLKLLEKQYFTMQVKYHPDKVKNNSEKQQNFTISMELNKAYGTLKDKLKRAEYMLSLKNINLNDEEARKRLNSSELNLFWEWFEIIENTEELNELEKMQEKYRQMQVAEYKNLSKAFQVNDLLSASFVTTKLKYLKTLNNNLQEKIALCK